MPMTTKKKRTVSFPKQQIEKYIIILDLHCPETDWKSLDAVNNYMGANGPWAGLIYIGDVLDFGCISAHNERNLRAVEGKRILQDYKVCDQEILKPHEQIIRIQNKDARIIWISGNHENRLCAVRATTP
jgi:hypothetical protein